MLLQLLWYNHYVKFFEMKWNCLMLTKEIRIEEIKKIYGNQEIKKQYLQKLFEITKSKEEILRILNLLQLVFTKIKMRIDLGMSQDF